MAIEVESFSVDMTLHTEDSFEYITSFNSALEIAQITIATQRVAATDIPSSQTPIFDGVQETVKVWIESSFGEDYNTRLKASSFNGNRYFVWAPEGGMRYLLNAGSELRVVISNKYSFGEFFGTITVNTL